MIHCISKKPPCELNNFVFYQQQNIRRNFSASKMHLSPRPMAKAGVLYRVKRCHYMLYVMDTKNENSNCIVLKCIFLLCTRSELDILLLHVIDWTNVWFLTVSLIRHLTMIVYKV